MQPPFNVLKNIAFKQVPCSSNIYSYTKSNISRMNKTNAVTTSWPVVITACHFVCIILIKFILMNTYWIKYNVHTLILVILIL
jgi:hypothetical protein